jgi:hypothetical protein
MANSDELSPLRLASHSGAQPRLAAEVFPDVLIFEDDDDFGEPHALDGIALPTPLNHLPHASRQPRVVRLARSTSVHRGVSPRNNTPVGEWRIPIESLSQVPRPSAVDFEGHELDSYLPSNHSKRKHVTCSRRSGIA